VVIDSREPRHGLARVLSKQGLCSRREAAAWVAAGRVQVDGQVVLDPEFPVQRSHQRVAVDGKPMGQASPCYLMLNKPRGLVTSASDERGRDTVYRCFDGSGLPWLGPVGRLDKASEGLLLFCNDPEWAARITDPATGPDKTYHVQVDAIPGPGLMEALLDDVVDEGEVLSARSAELLRTGTRNAWLQVVLEEGRNRHIRRLLAAHGLEVLRLVRVAVGPLRLGELGKGQFRPLSRDEILALAPPGATR